MDSTEVAFFSINKKSHNLNFLTGYLIRDKILYPNCIEHLFHFLNRDVRFVPFVVNLAHLEAKSDTPVPQQYGRPGEMFSIGN